MQRQRCNRDGVRSCFVLCSRGPPGSPSAVSAGMVRPSSSLACQPGVAPTTIPSTTSRFARHGCTSMVSMFGTPSTDAIRVVQPPAAALACASSMVNPTKFPTPKGSQSCQGSGTGQSVPGSARKPPPQSIQPQSMVIARHVGLPGHSSAGPGTEPSGHQRPRMQSPFGPMSDPSGQIGGAGHSSAGPGSDPSGHHRPMGQSTVFEELLHGTGHPPGSSIVAGGPRQPTTPPGQSAVVTFGSSWQGGRQPPGSSTVAGGPRQPSYSNEQSVLVEPLAHSNGRVGCSHFSIAAGSFSSSQLPHSQ